MANPRIEVEIGAKINEFEKKFEKVDDQVNKTGKQFTKLNEFAVGALQGIAAAFTVGAVVNFGKAVLDTTAKFQKFEAVLRTTLGSDSAAKIALNEIADFATKTPFQIDELTSAYIKLANQGFKPTTDQLTKLGDLAASTGKSFDQLAEAIIDAQVGEFERLKEFGIRASKQGDQVTFAFKGVETQVKNTSEEIQKYILSLGEAEGVSGSMANVSQTLGGKMSNLQDNIEQLRLAIGNQTSGIFADSLDWLNSFVEATTRAAKGVAKIREEADFKQLSTQFKANKQAVIELADAYQNLDPNLSKQDAFRKSIETISARFKEAKTNTQAFQNQQYTTSELNQIIDGFSDLFNEFVIGAPKVDKAAQTFEQFSKTWDDYNRGLQTTAILNDSLAKSFEGLNEKINSLSKAIIDSETAKEIEKIRKELGLIQEFEIKIPDTPPQQDDKPQEDTSFKTRFQLGLKSLEEEFKAYSGNFIAKVTEFVSTIKNIIQQNIFEAFVGVGEAIGSAFAKGENILAAVGQSLLDTLSTFLGDLGRQLIAFGVAGTAFGTLLEAIKKGGPASIPAGIGAIVAGTALVAISSAIRSRAASGPSGGGGSSVGTSGVGAGTNFTGGGLGFAFDPNREIRGELVARGADLVYVFNEANNRINKG